MSTTPTCPLLPSAPWAEIVPDAPYPLTIQDLLDWPDDDGYRYELVDGALVRMAGSGGRATVIGGNVYAALRAHARPRRLGVATPADGVYKFPGAETGLIPDAGYYVAARLAVYPDQSKPAPFAPDLAAEVASPDQTPADMAAKVHRYLHGGTRLVWVLWPDRHEADVWHPADLRPHYQDMRPSTTLHSAPTPTRCLTGKMWSLALRCRSPIRLQGRLAKRLPNAVMPACLGPLANGQRRRDRHAIAPCIDAVDVRTRRVVCGEVSCGHSAHAVRCGRHPCAAPPLRDRAA